jgi:TolA-binding protein/TM2 domain-containing membrane protein YozV
VGISETLADRRRPVRYWIVFSLIMISCSHALAADMLSFADSLAAEGDHYRAITEYKRFLHYHPGDPDCARAQLGIAQSLLAGQRWEAADQALATVWRNYPQSPQAATARQLYADAAYQRGDYAAAEKRYTQLQRRSPDALYRSGLSALQQDHPVEARAHFSKLPPATRQRLLQETEAYQQLPRKSPRLAGTLSALLPGAGQLYTERPRQAGIAFALNGAFIYGAVEAWGNENFAVAGILSLFELGWYGGNIYNAVNNAQQYNRRQRDSFLEQLQQRLGLSLGWHNNDPGVAVHFQF